MATPSPLILSFDTSAAHCAVGVLSGDRMIAQSCEETRRGQAERLMPLIEEILAGCGIAWRELDAIGVGTGPGNFTGIRISVAAARGLALALDRPAIGVSRLEALRFGLPAPVISCIQAPRDMVYLQHEGLSGTSLPRLCEISQLSDAELPVRAACVGDGAAPVAAAINGRVVAPGVPLSEGIARLASARFGMPQPRPAPLYIRAADAAPARDSAPILLP